MKKINREWKLTDSDTGQQGRQLTKVLFEFKEKDQQSLIDLSGYQNKDIEYIINAYGYTLMNGELKVKGLQNIHDLYGKETNWIIAECIFEQESGLY